jgi:hypothetical protein
MLALMKGTNPSYFLKGTGNNGDDRVGTLPAKSQSEGFYQRLVCLHLNKQNKTFHPVQTDSARCMF